MFPSLATQETLLPQQILRLRSKKMFLNKVKNIFALRTQILLPKHMFLSLATEETAKHFLVLPTKVLSPRKHALQETMFPQQCFLV